MAVVPKQLHKRIMEKNYRRPLSGHYSGYRLYNVLSNHWYWDGTYVPYGRLILRGKIFEVMVWWNDLIAL